MSLCDDLMSCSSEPAVSKAARLYCAGAIPLRQRLIFLCVQTAYLASCARTTRS